jgi:hypothetical protein
MSNHITSTSTPREIDIKVGRAMSTLYRVFDGELKRAAANASTYGSYWVDEEGDRKNTRFIVVSKKVGYGLPAETFFIDSTKTNCSAPRYGYFAIDGEIVATTRPVGGVENAVDILRKHTVSAEYVAREMAAENERCAEIIATIDEARAIRAAGDAEYTARGGWNRYFMVTSSSGHIHSSMGCSTCHKGKQDTTFALVADLSDADASEAVEVFGAALCSVCYPEAPVEFTNEIKITKAAAEAFDADGIDGFRAYTEKMAARKAKREGRAA